MQKTYIAPRTEVMQYGSDLMQDPGIGIIRGSGAGESKNFTDPTDIW